MRRLAFTLIAFACSVAFATTIYKWVDENGVVHYSDQPHANAQKLQITGVQTYSANSASLPGAGAPGEEKQANPYQGCAIAQPLDQQNLPNAQSVFVRVQSDPGLRAEDQVFITM